MSVWAAIFWILTCCLIFMIYLKYIPGIIVVAIFLFLIIFFWIVNSKKYTQRERFK